MRFLTSTLASIFVSVGLPCAAWAGPVDINTADATTLARELNGVGPARAQAIVAYRNEHGPFKSVDDLRLVKNMPQKVIDNNRELLRVDGAKSAAAKPAGSKADAKPAKP
ncbi:MAG TPA: helix-hairpin-helix domain-containing protein [Steroidobacteraceae bacterium]|jgi:competence protein ComEA|nr:helix-hairpin-helix domain-containing protein [Steroidobacteraceae bacterium]